MENLITEFLDKKVIDSLSTLLTTSNNDELKSSAVTVAGAFGHSGYRIDTKSDEQKLISSFKNNLSLLVEKTWVEQFDVSLKEEVLYKLDNFCNIVSQDKWLESYKIFINILNDVIYLMFGQQAKNADFGEYALRIDPGFGIFCWYVQHLPEANDWSEEKNKEVQNIAMYFLANY